MCSDHQNKIPLEVKTSYREILQQILSPEASIHVVSFGLQVTYCSGLLAGSVPAEGVPGV